MTDSCFLQGGCSPDVEPFPVSTVPDQIIDALTLPATGADVLLLVVVAVLLALAGTLCVIVARRFV